MRKIWVFPVPSALEIPKSFFLKARQRRAFKKTICIMRIAEKIIHLAPIHKSIIVLSQII
jgi:hypothetical protein